MLFALLISPCMQCGRNFQKLWPDSLISSPYNNAFPESNVYVGICDFLSLKQKVFQIPLSKEVSDTWIQDCTFFFLHNFMCMGVFPADMSVNRVHVQCHWGSEEGIGSLWNWCDRQLWRAMWGLGIKPRLVVLKNSSCFSHRAMSPLLAVAVVDRNHLQMIH